MSRIRLTIDRLVLNELPKGQDKALIESLQAELSRVLSNRTVRAEWAKAHRTPVLRLGNLPLANGAAGATKFGTQLARGIRRGLRP